MGALVEIFASGALQPSIAFTSPAGTYQAANLAPGSYRVKVTAASFLPSLVENVIVRSGGRAVINVTLSTLAQAIRPNARAGIVSAVFHPACIGLCRCSTSERLA